MSIQPTKIGIIGCGKQAEKHITSLQKLDNIAIIVADIVPANAQNWQSALA